METRSSRSGIDSLSLVYSTQVLSNRINHHGRTSHARRKRTRSLDTPHRRGFSGQFALFYGVQAGLALKLNNVFCPSGL